jgi:PAS domain S-box-containing protein
MDDRIRVLYVDDEPAFLDIAQLYLERMGDFKVSTSISAVEALEIPDIQSCDAIVSDYLMPEMDGIAFLKVIRERFGDIPFILFTGRGREEVVIQALNEGVDSYLQKGGDPKVQFAELVHKIRQAVRRKKAEEALRKSEEMYRTILVNIQDIYYRSDRNGNLIMFSPSGYHLLGYDPGDGILGANPADTLYANPGDRQQMLDAISEKGAVQDYEVNLRHKNGEIITVSANSHYYYDTDGRVAGIEGIFRDITEQKRSEEELKRSENLYRTVFDNTGTATILIGPDTTILRANAGWERLTGVPRSKQENIMSWTAFIHEDDVERMKEYHYARRRDAAAAPNIYECRVIDAKKQVHFGFIHVDVIPGTGNSVASLVDVTELKQVQEELKSGEAKIRTILDHLPDLIVVHRDGNILYVNPAMSDSMGWRTEEAVGQSVLKFIAPEYHSKIPDLIRTRLEDGIGEPYHLKLIAKDGKRRIVSIRGTVISFEGSPAIMNVLTDVTTAKKAEDALQKSEKKYRLLVENTNDIIYTTDLTGRITGISPQITKYGYSTEEVVSSNLSSFVLEEDLPVVLADLEKTITTGQPTRTIFRAKDKSGTIHWMEDNGVPIQDESGRVVGITGILRDITDRKITEEALRESEEKYRLLADHIQDVIWTAEVNLNLTYISPSVTALRGITVEEAMKEPLKDALTEESFGVLVKSRDKRVAAVENGEPLSKSMVLDLEFRCRDGSTVWTETVINPVFGSNGQMMGVMGVMRNITSRKRVEEALRKANRKLNLLSSITRHDISNQLLVVDGFVDLLQNEIDDPALSDYFSHITTANSRIADMIRFTKEYENIGVEAPVWHDLTEMLEILSVEILPEGVYLTCDLVHGTEVFADPMLKKAFFNLLDNAVRHGQRVTEIRVSSCRSGNDLIVVLEDDGVGIPADDKERIFEQGFGKNTGLGLFLVREILSLTGISIRECGEEGVGARFEITVPRGVCRIVGNNNQH